jgi:MFS family permease
VKTLLTNPTVRLLALAQIVSSVGSSAVWLASAIWIFSVTGNAGAAGLVMFFFGLSGLIGPLLGLVVDRCPRMLVLQVSSIAGVLILIPLLLVPDTHVLWAVYPVMFCYGTVNGVIGNALGAALPTIVDEEELAEVNGLLRSMRETLGLVTPLLAAGLYAWQGIELVVLLDMATFIVSAALFAVLRRRVSEPAAPPPGKDASFLSEVTAGFRHLRLTAVLRMVVFGVFLGIFVGGFAESGLFAVVSEGLGFSPEFVGVMGAVQAVGSILIGFFIGRIANRFGDVWITAAGLFTYGASVLLLLIPSVTTVLISMAVAGLGVPVFVVGMTTLIQKYTPDRMLGRVFSSVGFFISIGNIVSIALGAYLVGAIGFKSMYAIGAVMITAGALFALRARPAERDYAAKQPVGRGRVPADDDTGATGEAATPPDEIATTSSK